VELRLLLQSLTFSDGTKISTADAKIIVLVGPNNSGKSSTLGEIQSGAKSTKRVGPVLKTVTFDKHGSWAQLKLWLEQNVQQVDDPYDRGISYSWLGKTCPAAEAEENWKGRDLGALNGILCTLMDVEKRLGVAGAQESIDFFTEAPSHPVHVLFKNPKLETSVSEAFRAAFKTDLVLNRGGGKVIAFHVGNKPELSRGEDVLSRSYFDRLQKLPLLHNQGHGMRSFVGCTLHTFTSPAFIQLV
jgi:hypothetical protein